ncbi:MAG: hypothetical protein EOO68_33410 [Moraxellaceae bacterium]|nr:MAG: hypothetical protein EOO68_33410 [Moraxellaceae bacterium]
MKKVDDHSVKIIGDNAGDNFEAFLSHHLKQSRVYLDDESFAAGVLEKLPTKITNRTLSRFHEWLIIAVPLVIISALILSQFNVVALAIKMWTWLFIVDFANFIQLSLVCGFMMLASIGLWLAKQCRVL